MEQDTGSGCRESTEGKRNGHCGDLWREGGDKKDHQREKQLKGNIRPEGGGILQQADD